MDPLSLSASIAGIISLADAVFKYTYRYLHAARGANDEVQSLSTEIGGLSAVLRSLEGLAIALEADGQDPQRALDLRHLTNCYETIDDIRETLKKPLEDFDGDSKRARRSRQLKWPFSASKVHGILETISRHKETLSLATSAETLRQLRLLLSKNTEQARKIDKIYTEVEITTRIRTDDAKNRILDFFMSSQVNPQGPLKQSISLRHKNTGTWFLSSTQFDEWLQNPGSRIWLSGLPGTGKTILASAVIQESLERGSSESGVAFFFCDYKNKETLRPINVLGAIASQLARQRDDAFQLLQDHYEDLHPQRGLAAVPEEKELLDTICNMSDLFQQVMIVVDGIDECEDDCDDVLANLIGLAKQATTTSIALFSRREVDIEARLKTYFKEISVQAHTKDIELYVRAEMESRIANKQLVLDHPETKEKISDELNKRANGMFRWVVCQLDYLSQFDTDSDRCEALNDLPPTLHGSYQRLLERVNARPQKVQRLVQRCLQFIAHFPHRLYIRDLCHAVSELRETTSFLDDDNTVSEERIALHCSSLIRKSEDGQYFEFSHFTVSEFLRDESLEAAGLQAYSISIERSYPLMAMQCIKFLQLRNFDQQPSKTDEWIRATRTRCRIHRFYELAALYWPRLAWHCLDDENLIEMLKKFFRPPIKWYFRNWLEAFLVNLRQVLKQNDGDPVDWDSCRRETIDVALESRVKPLHVAAALSLPQICRFLVGVGADVNAPCSWGTPLYLSRVWFLDLLRRPEGSPSLVHSCGKSGLPPSTIRIATARSLAEAGATVCERPGLRSGPSLFGVTFTLDYVLEDFESTIAILSEGITPEQEDIDTFWKAAHLSGSKDLEQPMLNLLHHLKDSSAYNFEWGLQFGETIWQMATDSNFAFDKSLTDSRISLNHDEIPTWVTMLVSDDDAEAFQQCLSDKRFAMVTETIYWTNGNDSVHYSGTLLHFATQKGSSKCARLLLEAGADPHLEADNGDTAVLWAGDQSIAVLKVLVDHGVSLLCQNAEGYTLWHNCIHRDKGSPRLMRFLFEAQPEATKEAVFMENADGHTPLELALVRKGVLKSGPDWQESYALKMLELCNEVPSFWLKHRRIFNLAWAFGSSKVIESLLNLGLKPEVTLPGEESPLHLLPSFASVEFVELLKRNYYPDAVLERVDGVLPVIRYLETAIGDTQLPDEDVIKSLTCPEMFEPGDEMVMMPWESACVLRIPSTLGQEDTIRDLLDDVRSMLLELQWMAMYEKATGKCGVDLLMNAKPFVLDDSWWESPSFLISGHVLDEAVSTSQHWNPASEIAVGFLKSVLNTASPNLCQILLQRGVKVEQRTEGTSALEFACQPPTSSQLCSTAERRSILDSLLNHAESHHLRELTPGDEGLSLLHRVAEGGENPDKGWLVRQLVERGVDINVFNASNEQRDRFTPLGYHLWCRSSTSACLLLELGADPTFVHSSGLNAASLASSRGNVKFLKKLHKHAQDRGIDISWAETYRGSNGRLEKGPFFNNLAHVCGNGNLDCVEFFLDNNLIDVDQPQLNGSTALHSAAGGVQTSMVEVLIARGAGIDKASNQGHTPLHTAAHYGSLEAVKLLTASGAQNLPDASGMTPSMWAQAAKHKEIAQFLDQHFESTTGLTKATALSQKETNMMVKQLGLAIDNDNLERCKALFANGCPLDVTLSVGGCSGCSPLVYAMMRNRVEIAKWLLDNGASVFDVQCQRHGGKKPIFMAAGSESLSSIFPAVLEQHLKAGASSILSNDFIVALPDAAFWGNLPGVKLLLQKGADLDHLNAGDQGALQWAKTPEIVDLLLDSGASAIPILTETLADILSQPCGLYMLKACADRGVGLSSVKLNDGIFLPSQLPPFKSSPFDPALLIMLETAGIPLTDHRFGDNSLLNHLMMLPSAQAPLLSLVELDLETLEPFPWHWLSHATFLSGAPFLQDTFRHFQRRFSKPGVFKRWMNLEPTRGWSPLCRAASSNSVEILQNCIALGADIDFEGCPTGSALMIACACGQLKAVKLLVRSGAALRYVGRNGPVGVISVTRSRTVRRWILVDRFSEQRTIEGMTEGSEGCGRQTGLWSGICSARMRLLAYQRRSFMESTRDYAIRRAAIRREYRGYVAERIEVVHPPSAVGMGQEAIV